MEVNCTTTSNFFFWNVNVPDEHITCNHAFTLQSVNSVTDVCGFSITLMSADSEAPYITSSARLATAEASNNGTVLTCTSTFSTMPAANQVDSIILLVKGIDVDFAYNILDQL